MERDWDYTTDYCDGCAELGMTSCSCEPDGEEEICGNCGEPLPFGGDLCDECEEEEYNQDVDTWEPLMVKAVFDNET